MVDDATCMRVRKRPRHFLCDSGRFTRVQRAPVAYAFDYLMFFSDASRVLTLGVAAVAGVLVGAAAHALATGRFRWEGFRDTEDTANHLVGGALMGFGGVTAMGCTIGQGLSGVSTLAAGSFITVAAILAGVASWPLFATGLLAEAWPRWLTLLAGATIAAVFLGRGIAGYTSAWRRRFPEEPFATYDRSYYSPLCLVLGAGYLLILIAGHNS